jgi:hypothetical protein
MSQTINTSEWLKVVEQDYLNDFIKNEGAAVKFVAVNDEHTLANARGKLSAVAQESNFIYASVNAEQTKLHLVEQIFFQIARQIDWDALAIRFMRGMLEQEYNLPENDCDFTIDTLAKLNGCDPRLFRPIINSRLKDQLFRNYNMIQEFRIAMTLICTRQLDHDEVNEDLYLAIKEWFKGELHLISTLKNAFIYQKIGRNNGRNMLYSLARWLHLCGYNGLLLTLDISRYINDHKEPDGALYYSTSAVMDCYEVLRQFIDSTDEAGCCFITVFAPNRFLDLDEKRGVGIYDALKLRIWDEVYDRGQVNPLAPLIRMAD